MPELLFGPHASESASQWHAPRRHRRLAPRWPQWWLAADTAGHPWVSSSRFVPDVDPTMRAIGTVLISAKVRFPHDATRSCDTRVMKCPICLVVNTSPKISCSLDHHADPLVAWSYARVVTSPATTSPSPPLGATVLSGAQVRVLPAEARGGDPTPSPWRFVAPHRRSRRRLPGDQICDRALPPRGGTKCEALRRDRRPGLVTWDTGETGATMKDGCMLTHHPEIATQRSPVHLTPVLTATSNTSLPSDTIPHTPHAHVA
jgi:hypothetical protein